VASVFKRGGTANRRGYWYFSWIDHKGKRRTKCAKTTDKATAERIASKRESDTALRRDGVIDVADDRYAAQARRPVLEHLDDYHAALRGKGNTGRHCDESVMQAGRIIELCSARFPHDLTASAVQSAVKQLHDGGLSLRTCNHYLRAIRSFSRWLQRDKRTRDDALLTLRAYNASTDPKHVRRELSPDEMAVLISHTETRTRPEHNMPGRDRAMLYRLAFGTGFRAGELRSLTPESFDLEANPPQVTVAASHSKRRRNDSQPIRRDLADLLARWLKDKPSGEHLFANLPKGTARMLARDLKAARTAWIEEAKEPSERDRRANSEFLKYRNAAGEVFDFHSFRHAYISSIVNGGASVKVAQELARHSTPTLTIGRYAHTRLHDLKGALDALPSFTTSPKSPCGEPANSQPDAAADVATKTTDEPAQRQAQRARRDSVRNEARRDDDVYSRSSDGECSKSLAGNTQSDTSRERATVYKNYPYGDSNPGFRTENPTS